MSFARSHVFALDEFGGLAGTDPGRTTHTLQRQLMDALDLARSAFHFLDPDMADIQHCTDYDAAIGAGLDLMLLGIGLNGHLGMNDPVHGGQPDPPCRTARDSTVQSAARYFAHHNLPRWGLTVGLKALLNAREVWLLAKGSAKARIVHDTLHGEIGASNPGIASERPIPMPGCF